MYGGCCGQQEADGAVCGRLDPFPNPPEAIFRTDFPRLS